MILRELFLYFSLAKCKHICYHSNMRVVLDTCVIFQALYSQSGASHAILQMVRNGDLQMVISTPVFVEYCDVCLRKSSLELFELTEEDVWDVLNFIAYISVKIDIKYLLRPNLQDEGDNLIMELAFASDSRYLITKNVRDFTCNSDLHFDGVTVITPADFMQKVIRGNN